MDFLGILWNEIVMRPLINSLAFLADVLFDNFGLSIIALTIFIRLVLIPLTIVMLMLRTHHPIGQPYRRGAGAVDTFRP